MTDDARVPVTDDALVARLRAYRPTDEWGEGVHHVICTEAATALEAKDRRIAELEALDRPIDAPPNGEPDPSWAAIKRGIDQFVGRIPTVGKHRAMNNVHLKTVVERLDAAGDREAADTIVWQAWWRALDRERERFLLDDAHAALEPSDKGGGGEGLTRKGVDKQPACRRTRSN